MTFDELRLAVQPGEPFRQLLDGEKAEEKENSENPLEAGGKG